VPRFVALSLVASIVLTVLLNVALWVIPGIGQRIDEALRRAAERPKPSSGEPDRPRVRVVFPWRLMVLGSVVLTVLLNLFLWLSH
jgi:hypothetical protein